MKIQAGLQTTFGSLGGRPTAVPVGQAHPMSVLLFGKRPPRLVDRRKHPKLKKALRKLEHVCEQVAELLGKSGKDFSIELAEGRNACIDRQGTIAMGLELLEEHQGNDDLLVAILGHEIGHQPWSWPASLPNLTKKQLDALRKEEEAKADRFAGRVLADLDASPDAVCAFLMAREGFEARQPADYYPAKVRAEMVVAAFRARRRSMKSAAVAGIGGARTRPLR